METNTDMEGTNINNNSQTTNVNFDTWEVDPATDKFGISPDDIIEDANQQEANTPEDSLKTFLAEAEKLRLRPSDKVEPPIVVWKQKTQTGDDAYLGTLGDFSLIIGKAKSKKTFLLSLITSISLNSGTIGNLSGSLPANKKTILYFDTEQSDWYIHKHLKRICALSNIPEPENLRLYMLRIKTPSERFELIDKLICNTPNIGLVVIDGIRDLITSINSEEEACEIATKLLYWTTKYKIHIVTVLHQNKGDDKARGHIGTELINKAETVLSVTKDMDNVNISTVKGEFCRGLPPDEFSFEIINSMPELVTDPLKLSQRGKKDKDKEYKDIVGMEEDQLKVITREIFLKAKKPKLAYSDFVTFLRLCLTDSYGKKFNSKDIDTLRARMIQHDFIRQDGARQPWYSNLENKEIHVPIKVKNNKVVKPKLL